MCPYYRQLKKMTIKDKFHVDELLDKLHGEIFFTELYIHLGYHQIIMKWEDIPRISFRIHEGHFYILVIPFGLTNSPSKFQILMNYIFKPFLKIFVSIF
jgi:hypothetical protein